MSRTDAAAPSDPILLPFGPALAEALPRFRWLRAADDYPPRADPRGPRVGPLPPPPDAAGWHERWAVSAGNIVVPVEFYARAVPPEHLACLEARTIRPEIPGLPELLHLAIRFGAARPATG